MTLIRKYLFSASFAALVAFGSVPGIMTATPAVASEIKYVVNGVPVTSYDIQRRTAFLKLQHRKGNLAKEAGDEMVDQTLRAAEIRRLGIKISDKQINEAFGRFASSNKMSATQLTQVLQQAGVTAQHFKEFIGSQMGWNQALSARFKAQNGSMSEQDVVQRMLQQKGSKPSATEYMLQQVIFVVPAKERGQIGKRKREAEAMRARFSGCDKTREFAKGLIDVTVRDLGRVLAPELPPEWADQIKKTKTGGATTVRETERGVEFIGICSAREVSDDQVAKMVFQSEGTKDQQAEQLNKTYMEELRKRARIVKR
ncbi:periplasmic chaperone for outer membrane proteins SurA [Pseudaminobacter salicylatoxidans]|uniref:Periplasmic chaperone for outer membrane proteins SurA n=1 Tax=Pseudaminobacter salicylatoxidans TaxID=93369 RepID=A0A316C653_PSESE|nr:peptidylprolyl isomerase [Pseudaminobacter salicylatoxidans]PWJ85210.1 periplasmic chaperone for outer membrane proteins SurA [Pseudaminobacter salicylatoxidans]